MKATPIILQRMQMRRKIAYAGGYLPVFPNYHHQNRTDGFGCASLSPMSLGPLTIELKRKDGGSDNIYATCLENFWQGNKVFDVEADAKGEPTAQYYKVRDDTWNDPIPRRHKYTGNPKCLYFPWRLADGTETRLPYIAARQIYCTYYEMLAEQQADYKTLEAMLANGACLMICGYDAYPMDTSLDAICAEYKSPAVPFGHERTLMTMLLYPKEKRPWHIN